MGTFRFNRKQLSNGVLGLGVAALLGTGIAGVSAQNGGADAALAQGQNGVAGVIEVGDYFGAALTTGDFNGDNYEDLVVGAPLEDIGATTNGGAFHVLYGGPAGAGSRGDHLLHQDSFNVGGIAEADDLLGTSVAAGDFNNDGFSDLAIGAPGEDVGPLVDAGAVHVFYGDPTGLAGNVDLFLYQDAPNVGGVSEPYDEFGYALTTGDFDNDGHDDLAVGVPGEGIGPRAGAGLVQVFHGASWGIDVDRNVFFHQDTPNVVGLAEAGDLLGETLATGDFNGDGIDDLAAGAPGEGIGPLAGAGGVLVLYSTNGVGLTTDGNRFLHQDSIGIAGLAEADDQMGGALAAGDFDGDGFDDLAVGAPGEAIGPVEAAGGVHFLYGSQFGLNETDNRFYYQNSVNMPGISEAGDGFGSSLASVDITGDDLDDLLVGAPGEGMYGLPGVGLVHLFVGNADGLQINSQVWHQFDENAPGDPESGNSFGTSIAAGDFDGNGMMDVATGAPFDTVGGVTAGGSLLVLYGDAGQ